MLRWISWKRHRSSWENSRRNWWRKTRRLTLEGLEQRQMMDGGLALSLDQSGVLTIAGTELADAIAVREISGYIHVDGVSGSYDAGSLNKIVVDGRGGDDVVNLDSGAIHEQEAIVLSATIYGGEGKDTPTWGAGNDILVG